MKCQETHRIAPEGYPFIALALLLTVVGALTHPALMILFLALTGFVIYFFRNPIRRLCPETEVILAPAFGKVIYAGPAVEERFLKRPVQKVSIFMSPMDVHVNRVPVTGEVKAVSYNKGRYFAAYAEKASLENEQNAVLMQDEKGQEILFIQIAGFIARRIVCYAETGQKFKAGDIFGLIRFGSRMDVYVPASCQLRVQVGQRVKAGETVLANCA